METTKKMQIAIVVTALVALAYVVLLALKGAPQETNLIIMGEAWTNIPLPKELQFSYWWNLLVFPVAIIAIVHMCSLKEFVGEEPRTSKGMGAYKHLAKSHVFIMHIVANILAFGTVLVWATGEALFTDYVQGGPLTLLASSLVIWLATYVGMGFCIESAMTFFSWKTLVDPFYDDSPLTERYQKTFIAFSKAGFVKAFPMILGMTLSYLLRSAIELTASAVRWVISPIKRIKISIKQA